MSSIFDSAIKKEEGDLKLIATLNEDGDYISKLEVMKKGNTILEIETTPTGYRAKLVKPSIFGTYEVTKLEWSIGPYDDEPWFMNPKWLEESLSSDSLKKVYNEIIDYLTSLVDSYRINY